MAALLRRQAQGHDHYAGLCLGHVCVAELSPHTAGLQVVDKRAQALSTGL